jgi:hypothetical protein
MAWHHAATSLTKHLHGHKQHHETEKLVPPKHGGSSRSPAMRRHQRRVAAGKQQLHAQRAQPRCKTTQTSNRSINKNSNTS